jgi:hypothetical protein
VRACVGLPTQARCFSDRLQQNLGPPAIIEIVQKMDGTSHPPLTSAPQVLKPTWRQLGISDHRLNAAVAEIGLQRSGIGALVCQRIAGRMSEHARMALERQFGLNAGPLDEPIRPEMGPSCGAQTAAARIRQVDPAFRVSALKDLIPLRRPAGLLRFSDGLRQAGLPE